jgi:hypothetical protein
MPENPYESPKEVNGPPHRSGKLRILFNAVGFGASMIVGAVLGVPFFIGPSSSHMENILQLATGLIVGAVAGGFVYKVFVNR